MERSYLRTKPAIAGTAINSANGIALRISREQKPGTRSRSNRKPRRRQGHQLLLRRAGTRPGQADGARDRTSGQGVGRFPHRGVRQPPDTNRGRQLRRESAVHHQGRRFRRSQRLRLARRLHVRQHRPDYEGQQRSRARGRAGARDRARGRAPWHAPGHPRPARQLRHDSADLRGRMGRLCDSSSRQPGRPHGIPEVLPQHGGRGRSAGPAIHVQGGLRSDSSSSTSSRESRPWRRSSRALSRSSSPRTP